MDENIITSEKSFQIELKSNSNNSYSIIFSLNNSIEIKSNQINGIINKSYSSKYSFEEIKDNEFFLRYDALDDIFDDTSKYQKIKENVSKLGIKDSSSRIYNILKEMILNDKKFYW